MVSFKQATDVLGLPATELADVLSASPQSLRQARLDPDSEGFRTPPSGWEKAIARLARKRAAELVKLAEQLERSAG